MKLKLCDIMYSAISFELKLVILSNKVNFSGKTRKMSDTIVWVTLLTYYSMRLTIVFCWI